MAKKDSIEKRITSRLKGFVDVLKSDAVIAERFTCRTFVLDLEPARYSPNDVKSTRKLLSASQGMFAKFLGVSIKTVRAWEQGTNTPSDMACRFLDEIRRNPDYWRSRLRESVKLKQVR